VAFIAFLARWRLTFLREMIGQLIFVLTGLLDNALCNEKHKRL